MIRKLEWHVKSESEYKELTQGFMTVSDMIKL